MSKKAAVLKNLYKVVSYKQSVIWSKTIKTCKGKLSSQYNALI